MKLTGKAKEAFLDYVFKNNNVLDTSNKLYLNALIIEFFDSVGIYISPKKVVGIYWMYDILGHHISVFEDMQESRTEATNAAIEKANVIYNKYKL